MIRSSTRLPSYFIPHGAGPCFFMPWTLGPADTWNGMAQFLRGLGAAVGPRPRAVLVVSAHWEAPAFTVNAAAQPSLLYDYHGFPAPTYRLAYPASGAPALAQQVQDLLAAAGLPTGASHARGLDHGVFIPLMLVYPAADVPVLQLSLHHGLDAEAHLRAGRALAPLRDEQVLVLGSGMSFHNLDALGTSRYTAAADRFDRWLTQTVEHADPQQRDAALVQWLAAPAARLAHPREEHLLPLLVAAGAAAGDRGRCVYHESVMGHAISAFRFG